MNRITEFRLDTPQGFDVSTAVPHGEFHNEPITGYGTIGVVIKTIRFDWKGSPYFFLWIYHNESASLAECPTGLVMFLRPDFTTKRHHFITNPVGTNLSLV